MKLSLLLLILCGFFVIVFFVGRIKIKQKRIRDRIKSLKAHYRLWLNHSLPDLLSNEPQKVKNIFDKIYWHLKAFGFIWPIIGAGWLSWNLDTIKKSTSKFIEIFQRRNLHFRDYPIDWDTFIFDSLSILWLLIFLYVFFVEERTSKNNFNRVKSAIIRAPNMNVFRVARLNLNTVNNFNRNLKHLAEYEAGDFKDIDDLQVFFKTTILNIRTQARDYFNNLKIIGANVMIYIEKDQASQSLFEKVLLNSEQIYFRCEQESKLKGVLYLSKQLLGNTIKEHNTPSISIPVYSDYSQVYKNPNDDSEEYILPGAALAYSNGTSMIGNTRDVKRFFNLYDLKTQWELKSYFSNTGEGKKVRSLASFRLPSIDGPDNFKGVLNLHSPLSYAFGQDQEFFEIFYTMIYPILTILAEKLKIYDKYLQQHGP